MKKNSVLFLCQFFYPEVVSSATLPFDTALGLTMQGFEVGALCGYPKEYLLEKSNKLPNEEIVQSIRIKRLRYKTFSRKSFLGRIINYFSFTFKCLLHLKEIKQYEYVIVYSNPPILPYVAYKAHKKYGTKIIFVSYDIYPEIAIRSNSIGETSIISKLMRRINNKLFPNIYRFVALSEDMKRFVIDNRNIDKEKIKVIPNWFNEEKESFVSSTNKTPFVVSYFGNLGTCQDVDTLLEAVNFLKDNSNIKFVIGGHGNKIDYVKNYIESNGLNNIELKPFLTGQEYETAMLNTNCFVLSLIPNITDLCFPSKYYSYLNYGRPIIAVMDESELTKELISNHFGFGVLNGDYVSLAKYIQEIANLDNEKYDNMCLSSFNLYKKIYSKSFAMKRYGELLKED